MRILQLLKEIRSRTNRDRNRQCSINLALSFNNLRLKCTVRKNMYSLYFQEFAVFFKLI